MSLTNALFGACRTVIAGALPAVVANGKCIYDGEQLDEIPWEDLGPQIPYAAIVIEEMPAAEWSCDTQTFEPRVDIYIVREVHGKLDALRSDLDTLRQAFWFGAELSNGQVTEVSEMIWGKNLLPNQIFASKGMAHRAGKISLMCIIGEMGP